MSDDFAQVRWRKSSRSGNATAECVQVAQAGELVGVRDSKNPHGPILTVRRTQWAAFIADVKSHTFDR